MLVEQLPDRLQVTRVDLPPDAGAHTAFPLLGMTLTEFVRQKLPANAPAPGGGHDHGDAVPLSTAQAHRDFIAVVSESLANECEEPRQLVRFLDVTFETRPIGASTWTVPEASGNFCDRGGRFGPHNVHEPKPGYRIDGDTIYLTYFNGGLRVYDVRDATRPTEIGHYVPDAPDGQPAIQLNDVTVAEDGRIFVTDRLGGGLYVLEATAGLDAARPA